MQRTDADFNQLPLGSIGSVLGYRSSTTVELIGNFIGASGVANGGFGLVPQPLLGQQSYFLCADGTWKAVVSGGDMYLAGVQTNTGVKTFNNGTLLLRNAADTFSSQFTNSNTTTRTYTLPDANGLIAINPLTNTGDLFIAASGSTPGRLAPVITGNALISTGALSAPVWGKIGLTTHVSGILPITNGGTNLSGMGSALQQLRVNAAGTSLEYFTASVGGGITSLNGLSGASQTFANDTNVTIASVGTTHTLGWTGTLADARIASAATWNAKIGGAGTGGQIAYFTGIGTIASEAGFEYNPTTNKLTVNNVETPTILSTTSLSLGGTSLSVSIAGNTGTANYVLTANGVGGTVWAAIPASFAYGPPQQVPFVNTVPTSYLYSDLFKYDHPNNALYAPNLILKSVAAGNSEMIFAPGVCKITGLQTGNFDIAGANSGALFSGSVDGVSLRLFGGVVTSGVGNGGSITLSPGVGFGGGTDGKVILVGRINASTLPTSAAGLSSGDLWRNGTSIDIVP